MFADSWTTTTLLCYSKLIQKWLTKCQHLCSDNPGWQECWMFLPGWIKELFWDCSKWHSLLKGHQICWFNVLWTYNVTPSIQIKVCVPVRTHTMCQGLLFCHYVASIYTQQKQLQHWKVTSQYDNTRQTSTYSNCICIN